MNPRELPAALKEIARRVRLKAALGKGSGVPPAGLAEVYRPKSMAQFRVAENQAPLGNKRRRWAGN